MEKLKYTADTTLSIPYATHIVNWSLLVPLDPLERSKSNQHIHADVGNSWPTMYFIQVFYKSFPPSVLTSFGNKQEDSCVGRCDGGLDSGAACQCNGSCSDFGDCCSDYEAECLSCEDRCGIDYEPKLECQCNVDCGSHGNCCPDFNDFCEGVTGPPVNGN